MTRRTILFAAILVPAVLATAGSEFAGVRSEISAVRSELSQRVLESPRAAELAAEAGEWMTRAIEVIDEGDEDGAARVFRTLSKAMRTMLNAARKEQSESFDSFVRASNLRFWEGTAVLFAPENPAIPDPDPSRLEMRLSRKVSRAIRSAARERYPPAVRKLGGAWKLRLQVGRLP